MDTLVIRLIHPATTIFILKQLEELKLIEVMNTTSSDESNLSEKYAGNLPLVIADKMSKHIEKTPIEW